MMTAMPTRDDLRLPRERWSTHPNYPRQVLLLGSHEGFRKFSRALIEQTDADDDLEGIGWLFRYWKSAMAGHEAYEEGKLYPYLEARWSVSCDALRDGHHELSAVEQRVLDAVAAKDRAALQRALREHDEVLQAHLDVEEELVIPALLALEPSEFDAYYHGHIGTLLAGLHAGRGREAAAEG